MELPLIGATRTASFWTRLLATAACGACLCGTAVAQEQSRDAVRGRKPHAFHATMAGTCSNKDDFSFTGTAPGFFAGGAFRIHCVLAGNSTLGRFSAQIMAELQVTANACTTPEASGIEATFTGFITVVSFNATQDQLFLTLQDGSECLTPPGTHAPGRARLTVAGGTGRFKGATGTLVNAFEPTALAFSALGGDGFLSAFSGTLDGPIALK